MIFRRKVTPAGLAAAILTTPRAAWFYYGAVGLDDETRAWFRERPHRLLRIGAQVGAFAAFGPSLHVRDGRIASPGGPAADALWQALVGASPVDADAFVDKLLEARAGRVAWLYDTVSRLDPGAQRQLLEGDAARDRAAPPRRRLRPGQPRVADRGPAAVAAARESRDAAARARGARRRLAGPAGPAAWIGTLGRPVDVDAPWVVDRVFAGDPSASAIASTWRCSRCAGRATAASRPGAARSTCSPTRRRWR